MTLPLTEVDIRPWPLSQAGTTGVLAKHLPSGLSVIMTSHGAVNRNREAALRDLALIVAHRREITERCVTYE